MLQKIRDSLQAQKWLAYLVLGALALVFAAWGAYGIVNLSVGGANYAAEAGNQKVTIEAARNAWMQQQARYQQQLGAEIPAPQKLALQDRLLESMIREALLTERAQDLGYRVSQREILDTIHSEPGFQIEGVYNAAVAKDRLAQAGLSVDAFKDELRGSLERSQIQNGIAVSDFVTPVEMQRTQALQNEEREVRYAQISADKYAADVQVDDAAVQAYYKSREAQYMTAEAVRLQYAELRLDQLAAQVTPSDADIRAAYEKNKDRYMQAEKRHGRHILISVGKDDAAARKTAEDVLAQAKAGKDFAALAKQYSQDPGSAEKGGDLNWADRNQFVGPFSDALFSMNPGELRGPVKTQFGYHILRLDEIQPAKGKTLEEVRGELESELKRNAASDKFGETQEQLQAKLEQSGNDLDALVTQFKLQKGEVPQFLRGAGGAPLGVAQPIQELVFGDTALGIGRVGGPRLVGEDRLVLVKVLDHHKPEPKPIADVRDGIVAAIRKERGSQAAVKAAEDARKKLDAGASFDEIVKDLGSTAAPARFIGRTDPSVPTQIRELAFNSPKPTDKAVNRFVALPTGGAAVVAVTNMRAGATQPDKQQQEAQARQEASRQGMADASAYVEEMRRNADVRKNLKAFE